jgi:F-type H+-transporting ATPase subunit delta
MSVRLAGRYAKALIDFAVEKNSLEQVYQDMLYYQQVCRVSPEFVAVLVSPVINPDKKLKILEKVGGSNVGPLSTAFVGLLVRKGREAEFPEMIDAFIDQYNVIKGIHKVRLTTAVPVGEGVEAILKEKIKKDLSLDKVEFEAAVNADLIGGFTLELDGKMVDASIARDLTDIRRQFTQNIYVPKIFKQ